MSPTKFSISVETILHPTEDPAKVKKALETILEGEVLSRRYGKEQYLYIERKDLAALDNLHTRFRQQKILDVARKELRQGIVGNSTIFFFNKQSAFVNKLNFCALDGESPLGPIRVEITYRAIDRLIDWLAPYSKDGVEVKLVESFP